MKKRRTDVSERDTYIILKLLAAGRESVTRIGSQWLADSGSKAANLRHRASGWAGYRCRSLANTGLVRRVEVTARRGQSEWVYYELTGEGRQLLRVLDDGKELCKVRGKYQLTNKVEHDDLD